jgi:hypothetical protein
MPNQLFTNSGSFLPVSPLFDVTQIEQMNVNSQEFKELIVRLFLVMNDVIQVTNLKDTAYYLTTEFNTSGQLYAVNNNFLNTRPIFRCTIPCGALPAAGTKTIAHGITGIGTTYSALKIHGAATDQTAVDFIPLPYVSAAGSAGNLEVSIDTTNVYITTGGTDYSSYTVSYIVFEYVQF